MGDFLYGMLLVSVPLFSASAGALKESAALLIVWLMVCNLAAVIAYRFFCTRCPHYGGKDGKTRCLFIWGIPAVFHRQEGAYTKKELAISAITLVVVTLLPLTWLRMAPSLLLVYVLSSTVAAASIRRSECGRCVHTHCPSNHAGRVQFE